MTRPPNEPSPSASTESMPWAPPLWIGSNVTAWWRMLARHRFAVGWRYFFAAAMVSGASLFNSLLSLVERATVGRQARRTQFTEPPIFILGHWRSGTTLLHELMVLDQRHVHPTTYECLSPNHFLISEEFVTRWLPFLVPKKRLMDNMPFGWSRVQEEEFALCNMGLPSPYFKMAFPNLPVQDEAYYELDDVPPAERERWKQGLLRLLRRICYARPGRLVLKSPTHTFRIKILLEMFPDARFVYIVRDPYVVFPSTIKLWRKSHLSQCLQRPTFDDLNDYVFETFNRMHDAVEAQRGLAPPEHFHTLRYEDLTADPVGQMRTLYERLGLGGFEAMLPALENYLRETADYQTNRYQLSPATQAEITRRWGRFIEQHGYQRMPVGGE